MSPYDQHEEEGSDIELGVEVEVDDSKTIQASDLRKNGYIKIDGQACKVMELSTNTDGPDGEAQVHIITLDIFTQNKVERTYPSTENVIVPDIMRQEYTLIDITNDGYVALMAENADTREDVLLPDGELGDQIREEFDKEAGQVLVTVMCAVGTEKIVACKTGN
ncbi:hypothetical protein ACHAQI_012016 [Fusarium lateritium]